MQRGLIIKEYNVPVGEERKKMINKALDEKHRGCKNVSQDNERQ
jgi:hypothetical protein